MAAPPGPGAECAEADGPRVVVDVATVRASTEHGRWEIAWTVRCAGADSIAIHEAWLPHGCFRSPRCRYDPPIRVQPGAATTLTFDVASDQPPGSVVENAFVILNVEWRGAPWRIFARLRVETGPDRAPAPATELVTSQPVRFAG